MPNKNKALLQDLPKMILALSLIVGIGAVAGIMMYLANYESDIDPKPVSVGVKEQKASDITADWETYESKKYGFTMKYPSGWELSEGRNYDNTEKGVNFRYTDQDAHSSRAGVVWMSSYDKDSKRNINFDEMVDYFEKRAKEGEADLFVKREVKTVFNDIPAYNMTASKDGRYMDSSFMIVNNEVFAIACETENLENNLCKSTFNSMLSTFKFIEKTKPAFLGIKYKDVSFLSEAEKEKIGLSKDLDYGALIISDDLLEKLGSKSEDAGDGITDGSPAESAGLKAGDVILEIDGQKAPELVEIVEKYLPGDIISLKVLRGGKQMELEITLAEFPDIINQ